MPPTTVSAALVVLVVVALHENDADDAFILNSPVFQSGVINVPIVISLLVVFAVGCAPEPMTILLTPIVIVDPAL